MKNNVLLAESVEGDARLHRLGISRKILNRVGLASQGAAAATTRHHPLGYAGYVSYSIGTKTLRDETSKRKWTAEDVKGQPLAVRPDGKIVLTVCGGDSRTGRTKGQPKTRSVKGAATYGAALANVGYLFDDLRDDAIAEVARINAGLGRELWILLIYHDEAARETRSELSRPVTVVGGLGKKRQLSDWSDRIILPAIPFGDDFASAEQKPDEGNLSGEINVEIKRRA